MRGDDTEGRLPRALARLGVAAAFVTASAAAAGEPDAHAMESRALPWQRLRYEATKAVVLHAVVELEVLPAGPAPEAAAPLGTCADAPPWAGEASRPPLVVRGTSRALSSRASFTWIDPTSWTVLQVEEERQGRSWRLRRFTADGSHAWRAGPASRAEARGPRAAWSRRSDVHEAWRTPELAGVPATSSVGLLCLASSPALQRDGATLTAVMATREGPVRITLHARERTTARRPRRAQGDAGLPAGQGRAPEVPARRVELLAERVETDGSPAGVEVLGLRGPVDVLVDEATRVPLEVSGRVPGVGAVRLRLVEAVLASSAG
jgi:hypothetical protein